MSDQRAALVPVPRPGCVLLVVEDGDRVRFVLLDVRQLCRSPDHAWAALRIAWAQLAEQQREDQDPVSG